VLSVGTTDCQDENIHLDLHGYGESALVRGIDIVIAGKTGRFPLNRVKDTYRFVLQGHVKGTGETRDDRAESWRVSTDALMAALDLSLDPFAVEVGPDPPAQFPDASPYLGLTGAKSLTARCVSMVRGPVRSHMSFQSWSFEMECVDTPPVWVDADSS
jgi:hypothetical protein